MLSRFRRCRGTLPEDGEKSWGASKIIHLQSSVGETTATVPGTFLCQVGAARVAVYLSGDLAR